MQKEQTIFFLCILNVASFISGGILMPILKDYVSDKLQKYNKSKKYKPLRKDLINFIHDFNSNANNKQCSYGSLDKTIETKFGDARLNKLKNPLQKLKIINLTRNANSWSWVKIPFEYDINQLYKNILKGDYDAYFEI